MGTWTNIILVLVLGALIGFGWLLSQFERIETKLAICGAVLVAAICVYLAIHPHMILYAILALMFIVGGAALVIVICVGLKLIESGRERDAEDRRHERQQARKKVEAEERRARKLVEATKRRAEEERAAEERRQAEARKAAEEAELAALIAKADKDTPMF